MLGLSHILGQRHKSRETDALPYESGMVPTGPAHSRFDVLFYLNAMFFVIFDLETMFIIAWAIAYRDAGWAGYIEILIFIAILVASLIYLWKLGALDWQTTRQKILTQIRSANIHNVDIQETNAHPDSADPYRIR
ncbi:MAG: NADH-quinone oxidoreductase subunit A [Chloroflexi bacterium]|nr:MAG: NADH-quinone oxidoreductase subunit A [Chloroflexota bacterium]